MTPYFFVLTGGPCSGKTTLLKELAHRGCEVVTEAASEVLSEVWAGDGASALHGEKSDVLAIQRKILSLQLEKEAAARPPSNVSARGAGSGFPVFVDRGIGDHFGYLRIAGMAPFEELLEAWRAAQARYRAVFVLELNPCYEPEPPRLETLEEARLLHSALVEEYRARHPRTIDLAWCPVTERADRVLQEAESILNSKAEPSATSTEMFRRST
ncbi:MAG TPA: ATP-binding protein [Planctomycetota bacterium]|nr:ATP-binding protein [Planctomycetota bacterium]